MSQIAGKRKFSPHQLPLFERNPNWLEPGTEGIFKTEIETDRLNLRIAYNSLDAPSWVLAFSKEKLELVGFLGFSRRTISQAHAALDVVQEWRQQGYGTEMKYAILRFGFEDPKVQEFLAYIERKNEDSEKLHRRLGFEWNGVINRDENEVFYQSVLTRDDWNNRRPLIEKYFLHSSPERKHARQAEQAFHNRPFPSRRDQLEERIED